MRNNNVRVRRRVNIGTQYVRRNEKKKKVLIYNARLSSFPAADSTGVESTDKIKDGRVRRTYPLPVESARTRPIRNNKHIIYIARGRLRYFTAARFLDLGALLRLRAIAARAKSERSACAAADIFHILHSLLYCHVYNVRELSRTAICDARPLRVQPGRRGLRRRERGRRDDRAVVTRAGFRLEGTLGPEYRG